MSGFGGKPDIKDLPDRVRRFGESRPECILVVSNYADNESHVSPLESPVMFHTGQVRPSPMRIFVVANGTFWLAFLILFLIKSGTYEQHQKQFEERGPELIFSGRALSYLENEQPTPMLSATRLVQWPSFYAARPFFWYFNKHGIVVDHLYGKISLGGYHLLTVCALSFLQWSLPGYLVDFLVRRSPTKKADQRLHW
jgi:hypothetical protein